MAPLPSQAPWADHRLTARRARAAAWPHRAADRQPVTTLAGAAQTAAPASWFLARSSPLLTFPFPADVAARNSSIFAKLTTPWFSMPASMMATWRATWLLISGGTSLALLRTLVLTPTPPRLSRNIRHSRPAIGRGLTGMARHRLDFSNATPDQEFYEYAIVLRLTQKRRSFCAKADLQPFSPFLKTQGRSPTPARHSFHSFHRARARPYPACLRAPAPCRPGASGGISAAADGSVRRRTARSTSQVAVCPLQPACDRRAS